MIAELRAVVHSVFIAHKYLGLTISADQFKSNSGKEIFRIFSPILAARNSKSFMPIDDIAASLAGISITADTAKLATRWVSQLEVGAISLISPENIVEEGLELEYEEGEDIFTTLSWSELELAVKGLYSRGFLREAKIAALLVVLLVGISLNIDGFSQKASVLLAMDDILKSVATGTILPNTVPEHALELFSPQTANLLTKALTAAGNVAQSLEREDLDSNKLATETEAEKEVKKLLSSTKIE